MKANNNFSVLVFDHFLGWGNAGEYFDFKLEGRSTPNSPGSITAMRRVFCLENVAPGATHRVVGTKFNPTVDLGITAHERCMSASSDPVKTTLYSMVKEAGFLHEMQVHSKATLSWLLTNKIDEHGLTDVSTPKLYHVQTGAYRLNARCMAGNMDAPGGFDYMIKPNCGSRSRGHVYFKVKADQDVGHALHDITNELCNIKIIPQEENNTFYGTPVIPAAVEAWKKKEIEAFDFSPAVRENYDAVYHGGIDSDDKTGLQRITDSWVLQERVAPIAEFRVMKGRGKITAVYYRPYVKDKGLNIITSKFDELVGVTALEGMTRLLSIEHNLPKSKSIKELLEQATIPCPDFCSIDVGIVVNPKTGRLQATIFEYSPQFSVMDLGTRASAYIFRKWIAILLAEKHIVEGSESIFHEHEYITHEQMNKCNQPTIIVVEKEK